VATSGADNGNCSNSASPCATIQYAVDTASEGDEIRVAEGVYTDVQARSRNDVTTTGVVTQSIYLSKTVTIRGGFSLSNWITPSVYASKITIVDPFYKGRGLYITGDISPTISGLAFIHGKAVGLGGYSSYVYGDAGANAYIITATAVLSANYFGYNGLDYGYDYGAGVYMRASRSTLIRNNIFANKTQFRGAGVYLDYSPALIVNNNFEDNSAGTDGGAIYLEGSAAMITGNFIYRNDASAGGGLYLDQSPASVSGNNILNNRAAVAGGIFVGRSNAILFDNVIAMNYAGPFSMTRSRIEGGLGLAGGMWVANSHVTLTNNVIADNSSNSNRASGIYLSSFSRANFLQTTVARNTGGEAGITLEYDSILAMTNTIFVSHTVGITTSSYSTVTLNGVLWYGNNVNIGGLGFISTTNIYTGSPAFAADGYHLTAVSAAINRGVPISITTDIDGELRDVTPDLGADEYVGPPPLQIYFPLVFR
jgi:predicted outer membrane repeat protein